MKTCLLVGALVALTSLTACGTSPIAPGPGPDPSPTPFTLTGRVIASETDGSTGLSDVFVTATHDGFTRSTTTNADGDFAFDGLVEGEWTLSISRDGYVDTIRSVSVGADQDVTVPIDPKPADPVEGMLAARGPAVKTR